MATFRSPSRDGGATWTKTLSTTLGGSTMSYSPMSCAERLQQSLGPVAFPHTDVSAISDIHRLSLMLPLESSEDNRSTNRDLQDRRTSDPEPMMPTPLPLVSEVTVKAAGGEAVRMVSKKGLRLEFDGAHGGGERCVINTDGGTEVRYETVEGHDGHPSTHLHVVKLFAIGSRGMYDRTSAGAAPYPPEGAIVDETGSNFLELGLLGKGGSSHVVKAIHLPSMKMVAIKKVPIDDPVKLTQAIHELTELRRSQCIQGLRPDFMAASARGVSPTVEDKALADTSRAAAEYCPFLVSLYDAFKQEGQLKIVEEYMNGGSLQDLVDKGGTNDEELLAKITYNILRALHFLHVKHKVHRDIKPGNLLINTKNFVKVSDFGLASSLEKVRPQTVGTTRYLPPELLDCSESTSNGQVSHGVRPYDNAEDDEVEIASAVVDGPLPVVDSSYSDEYRDFLSKCMVKDHELRWSAEALLQHDFVRTKAYVHLNERELSEVIDKLVGFFAVHPEKAKVTPSMIRSLAREVHLDERFVRERLRASLGEVLTEEKGDATVCADGAAREGSGYSQGSGACEKVSRTTNGHGKATVGQGHNKDCMTSCVIV